MELNKDLVSSFHKRGWMIVEDLLTKNEVNAISSELSHELAMQGIGHMDQIIHEKCVVQGTESLIVQRWSSGNNGSEIHGQEEVKNGFLAPNVSARRKLASVAQSVIGVSDAQSLTVVNEQWLVKPPDREANTVFPWHQDGSRMAAEGGRAYVSLWVPLVDVYEENGTLGICNYSIEDEFRDDEWNGSNDPWSSWHPRASEMSVAPDCNCGSEDGVHTESCPGNAIRWLALNAGSLVVLSPGVWHCSRGNAGEETRSSWMPQLAGSEIVGGLNIPVRI